MGATDHAALMTVEQGAIGGFGAQVLHYLANSGQLEAGLAVRTLHLPDRFIDQASPAAMYAEAGLTAANIARVAKAAILLERRARVRPRLV